MSLSEKLTAVAANMQRVYDAGAANGGGGMDAFWDVFQNNGNRKDYSYAFYGSLTNDDGGWTDENLKPKYLVKPTVAQSMFEKSEVTTVDMSVADFSELTAFDVTFRNAKKLKTVEMNVSSAERMNQTFRGVGTLESLILVGLSASCTFSGTFTSCSSLADFHIYGKIGQNGFDVSSCKLLTAAGIVHHILANLEDKSATGGTWTITLGSYNLGKLTDAEKAMATQKGWTLA